MKKNDLRMITKIISYGFDGEVFLERDFYGVMTKKRVIEIQRKWDQIYGGLMRYEMVILK